MFNLVRGLKQAMNRWRSSIGRSPSAYAESFHSSDSKASFPSVFSSKVVTRDPHGRIAMSREEMLYFFYLGENPPWTFALTTFLHTPNQTVASTHTTNSFDSANVACELSNSLLR